MPPPDCRALESPDGLDCDLLLPGLNGYDERAASLVAELNGLGHDAEMVAGEKSQFDVIADGDTVWSKQQVGSFPELSDLLAQLK